jgi:hypothetical protein
MAHVMFTMSDAKYGDFLIDHWLRSVTEHIDLQAHQIGVVVLDYGLSEAQRHRLARSGISIVKCLRDGGIVNIRYRDMLRYLEGGQYDQVMSIDGGDVIIQRDIAALFSEHAEAYRAACEDVPCPFDSQAAQTWFEKYQLHDMAETLRGKSMINSGVILAPAEKFMHLCRACMQRITDNRQHGLDQIVVNDLLHRQGFVQLDNKYNFVLATAARKFTINDGIFCFEDGEVIPVVHNAGGKSLSRVVGNFGYGAGYNRIKFFSLYRLKRLLA